MTIIADPEFIYNDKLSYDDNFNIWRDMNDREKKIDGAPYLTLEEATSIFRKQWGYKATMFRTFNQSRLSA
mgnify:CR=1 FL=1